MKDRKIDQRKRGPKFISNRRAAALSSAAMISALWTFDPASGAVNSFFPGVSISVGASLNDPNNWSLGHVPGTTADQNEQLVIPTGGQVNGAVTVTFDGATIVGATLTHQGSSGRVLLNNSSTPATLQLNGLAGQPTIWDNNTSFQLSIGTATTASNTNNINLIFGSTDNEIRNSTSSSPNLIRIYADIGQVNPHTNVTLTTPNGVGSIILGGNNTFNGALNVMTGKFTADFTQKNGALIASDGSLIFNGGTMNLNGNTSGTSQTVAMTTFNAGSTQFLFNSGGAITTSTFDLGALARNTGATANFVAVQGTGVAPVIKTSTDNVNGIIGGWALTNGNAVATSVYNWAMRDVNGNIVPFTNYATKNDISTWLPNENVNIDIAANVTGTVGAVMINSLRTSLSTAGSLTINTSGLLTIASGGILPQGTAATTVSFAGSGALTSGTTDLIFIMPSGAGNKNVTVNIPIQDRVDESGTHPVGVTKSMGGTLTIVG